MTEDACRDVEIIGWLYQFYISEKKDQVFAGLKKNQKITAENIPAATQLFTPHWIVRYLVENSLGRLWLLNRPGSEAGRADGLLHRAGRARDGFPAIGRPEEIRICDPACGSGHMLTYAFDLLYAIYEEEGYDADRDPRADPDAQPDRGGDRRPRGGAGGLCAGDEGGGKAGAAAVPADGGEARHRVLQNVAFTPEMQDVAAVVGKDLFTDELRETLGQFEQAKNFGSLIVPKLRDPAETLRVVEARDFGGDLLLKEVQARVVAVLRMAEALSPKYHVVVANPPYMGAKGMNEAALKNFLGSQITQIKADLFAMFMKERILRLCKNGYVPMMTPQSWMFLSVFRKTPTIGYLEKKLTMAHWGLGLFDAWAKVFDNCCFHYYKRKLRHDPRTQVR